MWITLFNRIKDGQRGRANRREEYVYMSETQAV